MSTSQGDAALAPARTYSTRSAPQNAPPYTSSQHPNYAGMRSNTNDPTYQRQYSNQQHLSSPVIGPRRQRNNTADGANISSIPEGSIHTHENDFWETPQDQRNDSNLYQQSNISAPHLDANLSSGSRGPPLADDLGFDKLTIQGSRSGAASHSPIIGGSSNNAAGSERTDSAYANQQIYQSASEVQPENSLRAIAANVDQAATDIHHGQMTEADPNLNFNDSYYPSMHHHNASNAPYVPNIFSNAGTSSQQAWYGQEGQYYDDGQQNSQYSNYGHYGQQPYAGIHHANTNVAMGMTQYNTANSVDPYGVAAAGFGLEYPGQQPQQYSGYEMGDSVPPMATLNRQTTQMSVTSAHSTSSAAARRRSKDDAVKAVQQQLPFNKSFVDEYRHRMKGDPDAEAQFAYARYLIEAAKKVHDPKDGPKQARKYRDTLLGESLKLIKRLATTGIAIGKPPYSEAQFFLANCFGNGSLGLQVDHEKAYNLYVQASKQNHAAATYRTAVCNEVGAGTRRDHHRAVLFYRKASALGDTAGMYKLGMILLNGLLGQPRNIREAIVWLKRAAGQADEDNPHALHELGLLHEKPSNSNVIPHDEAYARELFTQAAQLGYAPSQFKLGSAYEYGSLTCPVDPRRSIAWYTKAAGKNDGESELALSGWYLTGSEGVLKQSDSEAYLWARRAATKGIAKAEYAVGYYSEVGIGVAADIEEAKRWYMRAAAQGNKRAMMRLTELKQQKGLKIGKKGARPTRKDAETECIVM